jgi:hypothetical protein
MVESSPPTDYLDDLSRPASAADVLRLAMSAYSEAMWCAGWMSGLEEELWQQGGGWHDIARAVGGWWTYERFVPLDEWLETHPCPG